MNLPGSSRWILRATEKSSVDSRISSLINATEEGNDAAAAELFATLYAELHRLAQRELARSGAGSASASRPCSTKRTSISHAAMVSRFRIARSSWAMPRGPCEASSSSMCDTGALRSAEDALRSSAWSRNRRDAAG